MNETADRFSWPEWIAAATLLAAVIAFTGGAVAATQQIVPVEGTVSSSVLESAIELEDVAERW